MKHPKKGCPRICLSIVMRYDHGLSGRGMGEVRGGGGEHQENGWSQRSATQKPKNEKPGKNASNHGPAMQALTNPAADICWPLNHISSQVLRNYCEWPPSTLGESPVERNNGDGGCGQAVCNLGRLIGIRNQCSPANKRCWSLMQP